MFMNNQSQSPFYEEVATDFEKLSTYNPRRQNLHLKDKHTITKNPIFDTILTTNKNKPQKRQTHGKATQSSIHTCTPHGQHLQFNYIRQHQQNEQYYNIYYNTIT
jgi:hypothetical protein